MSTAERKQRNSQSKRILDLLRAASGRWVPAPEVAKVGGLQYSRGIHTIRHRWGYNIENKTEHVNGVCHGYFRLAEKPATATSALTVPLPTGIDERNRMLDGLLDSWEVSAPAPGFKDPEEGAFR